jgi:hypothetical protein
MNKIIKNNYTNIYYNKNIHFFLMDDEIQNDNIQNEDIKNPLFLDEDGIKKLRSQFKYQKHMNQLEQKVDDNSGDKKYCKYCNKYYQKNNSTNHKNTKMHKFSMNIIDNIVRNMHTK